MRLLILFLISTLISCSENSVEEKIQLKDSIISKSIKFGPKLLYDSTNTLEDKIQTLELDYIAWGCACANWITLSDLKKYGDSEQLEPHCFFIEPADSALNTADNIIPMEDYIKVTGQFYTKKGYPKGTFEEEEHLDSAKVFRYTKISIFKHKKDR
jgi:hypothetical protein